MNDLTIRLSILFILISSLSTSLALGQDEATFLPPVNSIGETIQDETLLTVTSDQSKGDNRKKKTPEIRENSGLPAEEIVSRKKLKFQQLRSQLQELTLIWEAMREQKPESKSTHQEQLSSEPRPSTPDSKVPTGHDNEAPITESISTEPEDASIPPVDVILSEVPLESNSLQPDGPPEIISQSDSHNSILDLKNSTTPQPVDRFALATSLYAINHFDEALQVIDSVQLEGLSEYELTWLDYIRAGCHRHKNEIDEANRFYRRIVANPESDWIGEISRWWLEHGSEKRKSEADYLNLKTALQQWELTVDELTK